MDKPKQEDPRKIAKEGWSYYEQVGYNQAVADYEAYIVERLEKMQEYCVDVDQLDQLIKEIKGEK